MNKEKKQALTVTLWGDRQVRAQLEAMAQAERRSLSSMMRVLIAEGAQRRGIEQAVVMTMEPSA